MVLEQTRGKIGETAKIAGIHPRGLYGKMKKEIRASISFVDFLKFVTKWVVGVPKSISI